MIISNNVTKISTSLKQYPKTKIMAVIKNRSLLEIEEVVNRGINILGVNRWQEFKKIFVDNNIVETGRDLSVQNRILNNKKIQFHFIGHLQKNKVRDVVKYFNFIDSVDSIELAKKINVETCHGMSEPIKILIQINISRDPNKHGILPENVAEFLSSVRNLDNIEVQGFMTITARENIADTKKDFHAMKELFDQYKEQYHLSELSMGMSNDYQVAAQEGATVVRVGTLIFT